MDRYKLQRLLDMIGCLARALSFAATKTHVETVKQKATKALV